ncbi:MAG: YkgJ family cysteine cluster protein [Bacteroidota bacterium]
MSDTPVFDPEAPVLCSNCAACCCRLEVMLFGDAAVPARYTVENRWGGWVMRRLEDGWCAALDRNTMRCTIYERRPDVCRDYEMGDSDCVIERVKFFARHTTE